ncbi:MAG: isoaspartyl peptidase/L-asparaginase [Proteobacteria bacterium]|nr:isoaspartyl peptidase/L-asparaginase [Pseudomonadota bacterium]
MRELLIILLLIISSPDMNAEPASGKHPVAIAIHGGAGTIIKDNMSAEKEAAIRAKLEQALMAGHKVLINGGDALDAVTIAITTLEDSPLFNAGKGAVYTYDGSNEMDASIMDGGNLNAGAVAGVSRIKNPILAARAVMDQSPHVLLSGSGAEAFSASVGLKLVEPAYFQTEFRRQQWENSHKPATAAIQSATDKWFSTVGAVALDQGGDLAAGTSTGGMLNKRWGRVGDSPIIGAGTYADSRTCAISATGHGEFFIRAAVAHDICSRARYLKIPLTEAAEAVIHKDLVGMGASGGVITLDPSGNIGLVFNTPGMYRASIDTRGKATIKIYRP